MTPRDFLGVLYVPTFVRLPLRKDEYRRLDNKGRPGEFCFSSSAASLPSSSVARIVPALPVTGQGGLLLVASSGMELGLCLPHLCHLLRQPWPIRGGRRCAEEVAFSSPSLFHRENQGSEAWWLGPGHSGSESAGQAGPVLLEGVYCSFTWKRCISGVQGLASRPGGVRLPVPFLESALCPCTEEQISGH